MEFEDALCFELESVQGFSDKVFPMFSPGKKAPYLVYLSSEGVGVKDLGGYTGRCRIPVELNIVTANYSEMKTYTKAVIKKLISMEQRAIGNDGPFVQELTYETPAEIYEEAPKLHRCVIDFVVHI